MRILLLSFLIACTGPKADDADSGTITTPEPGTTDSAGDDGNDGGEADADSDDADDADTDNNQEDGGSGDDCTSELGTIEGQILLDLDWGSGPEIAPFARVTATPSEGEPITISSDEEGRFTTPLPADEYLLMAEGSNCISEQFSISLEPCETESHTIRLVDCMLGD